MFYTNPSLSNVHLIVLYRNFKAISTAYSHTGLGVNSFHTNKTLRKEGIRADVYGIKDYKDIKNILSNPINKSCSHCLIEAIFVNSSNLHQLLRDYPHIHFIIRNHSQIGFLQVEQNAINLVNGYTELQDTESNFTYASNNKHYSDYFEQVYNSRCLYLPNLYCLDRVSPKQQVSHDHKLLKIGCFCAIRLLKNITTSAAAAQLIAKQRNCDLHFYLSVNREEHGQGVLSAVKNMFKKLKYAKLIENPWEDWANFRHTIAHMDLCLQATFTETFNIVSADACSERVPVVGSTAIDWLPERWQANSDDPRDIAEIGNNLLSNARSGEIGFQALRSYCDKAITVWKDYLNSNPT